MKYTFAFLAVLWLVGIAWSAPDKTDLMFCGSLGKMSHPEYNGIDPRLGAAMSIPLFYDFLKLDAELDAKALYNLGASHTVKGHDQIDGQTDWTRYYETKYDPRGFALIITPRPTVYLRRLYFGVGVSGLIGYEKYVSTKTYYSSQTGEELTTVNDSEGGVLFEQYNPSVCVGIHHKRLSAHYYQVGVDTYGIKMRFRIREIDWAIGKKQERAN